MLLSLDELSFKKWDFFHDSSYQWNGGLSWNVEVSAKEFLV